MFTRALLLPLTLTVAGGCAASKAALRPAEARERVLATERAFAATMAGRDLAAFTTFLSQDTVFFQGATPLRGPRAVTDAWQQYFDGPAAPFSWEPTTVEVLDSGDLALTSGPVHDSAGAVIGTFNSIWRLEGPDTWRVVFDKGCRVCPPAP